MGPSRTDCDHLIAPLVTMTTGSKPWFGVAALDGNSSVELGGTNPDHHALFFPPRFSIM
jgi:hypothetical protein